MILQIKNLHNDTFPIECEETETVKDIKNKIAAKDDLREKYTFEILKLLYKGKVMEDDQTIASFTIPDDGYLLLVKQTPGKAPVPKKKKNQILFNLLEGLQTLSAMAQMSDPYMKSPFQSPLQQPFSLNSPMNQSIQPNADWQQSLQIKPAMHKPLHAGAGMNSPFHAGAGMNPTFQAGAGMNPSFGGSSDIHPPFGSSSDIHPPFGSSSDIHPPFSSSAEMPSSLGSSSFSPSFDGPPSGFSGEDSIGFPPSAHFKNEEHEQALNTLVEMGFEKKRAEKALRATNFNLDGATELLTSGAVDALADSDVLPPGGHSGRRGANMDPKALAEALRKNPAQLQQLKQSLKSRDPQAAAMIDTNPEGFIDMISKMSLGGGGGGGGGAVDDIDVSIAPHEEKIIDELIEMGFSRNRAKEAFVACDRNKEAAIHYLLQNAE